MDFLHTTSQSDLGVFALGLVLAGAVSGLAAGVLGIGGGIVIVPVLYHVMTALGIADGVCMHVAIATALAAMIPAALAHVQNAKGKIDWPEVRRRAAPLLAGVVPGCVLAVVLNANVLVIIFGVVAMTVVLTLLLHKPKGVAARTPGGAAMLLMTVVSGFVSVLTGTAADTLCRCAPGVSEADGNRAGVSVLALAVSIAATLAYGIAGWNVPDLPPDSVGYVNLLGFALIAPVLLATEPAGAALAHMMDLRRLRLAFAVLIVIATARMLWDALA